MLHGFFIAFGILLLLISRVCYTYADGDGACGSVAIITDLLSIAILVLTYLDYYGVIDI